MIAVQEKLDMGPAAEAAGPTILPPDSYVWISSYDRGRCRGCGALVMWVTKVDGLGNVRVNRSGRPVREPIDPYPLPDGGIQLLGDGKAITAPPTVFVAQRWRSHFLSCPERAQFTGRGRRA